MSNKVYIRKRVDLDTEKDLIIGMIMSDKFLKDIHDVLEDMSLIKSVYLRKIASWCMEYYGENEKAPKKSIEDIFNHYVKDLDENTAEAIEDVLQLLNTKYLDNDEEFDYGFFYKKSEGYLRSRSLEALATDVKFLLTDNQIAEAETLVANYKRIERPLGTGVDVFDDPDAVARMFEGDEESLFNIPGALGDAVKDIYRGDILAFGGASKRGKTWWMMQFALYALLSSKLKVAFFTLEMKESVMMRRIYQNIMGVTKHPVDDAIEIPEFDKDYNIDFKYVKPKHLSMVGATRYQKKFKRQIRQGQLRIYDITSGGVSVKEICATLDRDLHYNDFAPDVVVIDYADILSTAGGYGEKRHKDTENWIAMKQDIAQRRDCLVITASQLGRAAIKNDAGVENIAENIRKFDQVSHWITLNQTAVEKKANLMRIKIDGRHDNFEGIDEVVCLQALALGRPIIDSQWKSKIPNYKEVLEGIG